MRCLWLDEVQTTGSGVKCIFWGQAVNHKLSTYGVPIVEKPKIRPRSWQRFDGVDLLFV